MIEKYIYTGLLSFSLYVFSVYIMIAESPFFMGTHFLKHKPLEWVYVQYGPLALSALFILMALLLTKLSHGQSKTVSNKEEDGESAISAVHLVIGIVIIFIYIVI